ncbi:interferon-inducible GTPase 5-like [Heptranchias perlo]|uniref:interferon-inducible GTPase 5-like n=1 Tax=Heptranchias perlo TaxID=212740 RepID=UPI00355A911E
MMMFFYELVISLKNYISYYLGRPAPETTRCLRKSSVKKNQTTGAKKFTNVAVTGLVASGKSTLIDAIRRLEDEEEGNPLVGKCEAIPRAYAYQDNPNVLLWDLPGIEGNEVQQQAYVEKVDLRAYDFFIVVSSTRVSEELLYLAIEIEKMGKRFFFVRTKIDIYARNTKQQNFNQGDLLREIRRHFTKKLQGIGIKFPRVFLLSALQKDKFDFPDFLEAFNNEF